MVVFRAPTLLQMTAMMMKKTPQSTPSAMVKVCFFAGGGTEASMSAGRCQEPAPESS